MRILFVAPPTRTSHEIDTLRSIPNAEIVAVGDPTHRSGVDIALPSRRIPVLGSPERWTAALAWLVDLDKIDPGPIDIVMTTELYCPVSVQAEQLATRLGVPCIVLLQEILDRNPLYRVPPWRGYARRNAATLDGALCSTPTGRRHALHRGIDPDRILVVAPGVDTEVFHPAPQRPPTPRAVFVGELRRDKGVIDVISAGDVIAARLGSAFRLRIVGDGPLRSSVERAAASRPWLDVVGNVQRSEVPEILRSASAFVLAPHSRRFWVEQFGFASIEAMACGLPVVTTRCGAVPDVVPPHNSLTEEGDVAALAAGLERALGPEGLTWGHQNREHARQHFDLKRQGAALRAELTRFLEAYSPRVA